MIDESGCYVSGVEMVPAPLPLYYPCEKMDICYNSGVNNGLAVAEGQDCGGDNEWGEKEKEKDEQEVEGKGDGDDRENTKSKKFSHNRDNASIVSEGKGEQTGAVTVITTSSSFSNEDFSKTLFSLPVSKVNNNKPSDKNRKKRSKCLQSKMVDRCSHRPRTILRRIMLEKGLADKSPKGTAKGKWQHLSKDRKRSMSVREWCHMQEINLAFESLRNALPSGYSSCADGYNDTSASAKMTTLRLALRYIAALTQLLEEDQECPTTDEECKKSCCVEEHTHDAEGGINNGNCNECLTCRDNNVSRHRNLDAYEEEEEGNCKSNHPHCLDYRGHIPDDTVSHDCTNHHTATLHLDRHKRPRYHTEENDSHEALGDRNAPSTDPIHKTTVDGVREEKEEHEEEEEEEEDPDSYIEAIADMFKEPGSSFNPKESCPYQKAFHITPQKEDKVRVVGSAALPKTHPTSRVTRGQKDDPCPSREKRRGVEGAENFVNLSDYHAESHLEMLDDLEQLSNAQTDAILLASNADGDV